MTANEPRTEATPTGVSTSSAPPVRLAQILPATIFRRVSRLPPSEGARDWTAKEVLEPRRRTVPSLKSSHALESSPVLASPPWPSRYPTVAATNASPLEPRAVTSFCTSATVTWPMLAVGVSVGGVAGAAGGAGGGGKTGVIPIWGGQGSWVSSRPKKAASRGQRDFSAWPSS